MTVVAFTVYGQPAPAGSKTAGRTKTGQTFVRDSSKRSYPWKRDVAQAAGIAMRARPLLDGPLMVELVFHVPRPKGHFGKRGLLPSAPEQAQNAQADAHQRGELFDADIYEREDLALPKVDGRGIDKIRIAFSGSIMLDRSNPDHVALFKDLELGKDVELRVAGDVSSTGTGWTTNKDGDLDAIVSERKIKVSTVYMLKPEEL